MTLPANVVTTIRPDTVFIPYHWPGRQAANQLTNRALDPISKIPEYKVSRGARRARVRRRPGGRRPARHGPACHGGGVVTASVPVSIGVKRSAATWPIAGAFGNSIFVIDQSRCIGCEACVEACEECGTHRGVSLIHLDEVDRGVTTQTVPMVCMHCEDPTCAEVCPADAIKQNEDGVVQSALKPRCIGCSNCVLACPFGVPKYQAEIDQMMKCDMCFDRTSVGLKPMCASVCPSEALWFGSPELFASTAPARWSTNGSSAGRRWRPRSAPSSTNPVPIDVLAGSAYRAWQDDPFGLDGGCGDEHDPRRRRRSTSRSGAPISRSPRLARTTSRGASSCATSSLRPAVSLPAASGSALWSSLRSVNTGEPRAIVSLDDVPEGTAHLFRYPTNDDPAILVHLPGGDAQGVQPEVHPPRLRRLLRGGHQQDGLPVPRGPVRRRLRRRHQRAATATARAHRRRGPRQHRVGDGQRRRKPRLMASPRQPARPRRVVRDVPVALGAFVVVLLALQMFLLTVGVDALLSDQDGLAWTTAGFSVLLAAGSIGFYRYLR